MHGNFSVQELGDVVAQCLQTQPDERPSAAHLLKHKFFRLAARDPQNLVRRLWNGVPEGHQDASSHPSGVCTHAAAVSCLNLSAWLSGCPVKLGADILYLWNILS
jgi:hypothetical protein